MISYKTNMQLSIIDNLYLAKEKELKLLAGNLQPHDITTDEDFQATVEGIKNRILLNTIIFGQPKITDHYQETRQMPSSYQNPWGGPKEVFVVTVQYRFTGSDELFNHTPNNVSVPIGHIYQPYGNSIDIEVTIDSLDKNKALAQANTLMQTTFEVIKANSLQAEVWSKNIEPVIDATLEQKRKEILDFYN